MDRETEAHWHRVTVEENPAFARFMGVRFTNGSRDRIEAELTVGEELANRNGVMHGGAIMAFADILGGAASVLNLPDGARTTTIESKTNFFRAISLGETARAVCIPLHRGRTTMVWQTTIMRADEGSRHRHSNPARHGRVATPLCSLLRALTGPQQGACSTPTGPGIPADV